MRNPKKADSGKSPDISLTAVELDAEMEVFKGEIEMMATWTAILINVMTGLPVAVGKLLLGRDGLAALGVLVTGAVLGSTVLARIRKRNQRLWDNFERQIEQA